MGISKIFFRVVCSCKSSVEQKSCVLDKQFKFGTISTYVLAERYQSAVKQKKMEKMENRLY